jgi:nucleotide-binding universal stress UspA family protein
LQDIGVAMHEHAAIGDEIIELLRAELDPIERSSLADGLAAARSTSTVSRLYRSALRTPPSVTPSLPQRHDEEVDAAGPPAARSNLPEDDAPLAGAHPVRDKDPQVEPTNPAVIGPAAPRPTRTPPRDKAEALSRMLVGVDGSPAADAALEWAGRFAGQVGAEVLVANVFEPEQAEISPDDYEKLIADAERRLAEDWAAPLRGAAVRHRCLQLTGTPDSLLAATEAEDADLLVVGTRGAGRHAGLHLGSLAHHLAHYTRGPLAIVPIAGAASSIDRIVVGVDGSPGSAAAVRWCADIAATVGAEVSAVCAFDPHPRGGFGDDASGWRTTAERAISAERIEPLQAAGVVVRTRIVEGTHPLGALEAVAAEEGAGLFVVGSRGLSAVGGLRLGRLPLQLVHHTHLPVVIVPPADRI